MKDFRWRSRGALLGLLAAGALIVAATPVLAGSSQGKKKARKSYDLRADG